MKNTKKTFNFGSIQSNFSLWNGLGCLLLEVMLVDRLCRHAAKLPLFLRRTSPCWISSFVSWTVAEGWTGKEIISSKLVLQIERSGVPKSLPAFSCANSTRGRRKWRRVRLLRWLGLFLSSHCRSVGCTNAIVAGLLNGLYDRFMSFRLGGIMGSCRPHLCGIVGSFEFWIGFNNDNVRLRKTDGWYGNHLFRIWYGLLIIPLSWWQSGWTVLSRLTFHMKTSALLEYGVIDRNIPVIWRIVMVNWFVNIDVQNRLSFV